MSLKFKPIVSKALTKLSRRFRQPTSLRALRSVEGDILPPIFGLPIEVLCSIFHICRLLATDSYDWIAVTAVCRHWRAAALSDATLWTVVPLRNKKWTRFILERSKDAELVLYLRGRGGELPLIVPEVIANFPRVAELMMDNHAVVPLRWLFEEPSPRMTMLRTLAIRSPSKPPGSHRNFLAESVLLPLPLFHGVTSLQNLALCSVSFDWTTHFFTDSLERLYLSSVSRPTAAECMSAMRKLTALKHLSLNDALPTWRTLSERTAFNLPDRPLLLLNSLELDSEPEEIDWFFTHISLAQHLKRLTIRTTVPVYGDKSIIPQLLATINGQRPVSRLLGDPQRLSLSDSAYTHQFGWNAPSTDGDALLTLVADGLHEEMNGKNVHIQVRHQHDREANIVDVLSAVHLSAMNLLAAFEWRNLRELDLTQLHDSISTSGFTFRKTLEATLGTHRTIDTIATSCCTTQTIADILYYGPTGDDTYQVTDPRRLGYATIFPALKTIRICAMDFSDVDVTVFTLIGAVKTRFLQGSGIETLYLETCHGLGDDELTELRQFVKHLERVPRQGRSVHLEPRIN